MGEDGGKDEAPSLPACIPPGTSPYYRSHLRATICKASRRAFETSDFLRLIVGILSKVKNLVSGTGMTDDRQPRKRRRRRRRGSGAPNGNGDTNMNGNAAPNGNVLQSNDRSYGGGRRR